MKKIVGYEEAKELLKKGKKIYHHRATEKNWIYMNKYDLGKTIRKKTFEKLLQEKIIKMERNDFDEFNFIEMYSVK